MSILNQLSSQAGDRTEAANRRVVAQCLADPTLLAEIAGGLQSKEAALAGDCAEVMTKVAEVNTFATELLRRYTEEVQDIRLARCKVRAVSE